MRAGELRSIEDGPVGGTMIRFGNDVIGQAVEASPAAGGWNLSRIADISLAQTAHQISAEGRLWLPAMSKTEVTSIPVTTVSAIGAIGPYHADINGLTSTGAVRGPFEIMPATAGTAPTYPVLWAHDCASQCSISFEGESEGIPRKGASPKEQVVVGQKVENVWASASHCHFNRDFQFNSQSTSMQFTPRRSIGGRAWISIQLSSVEYEKALVLWANTSLGLLLHWFNANKQQVGRGNMGVLVLKEYPILDVTALDPRQLEEACTLFDEISELPLLPLHLLDEDPVRKRLDDRFAQDVLGLPASLCTTGGPLWLLRMKLAREPSVRGHKSQKNRGPTGN
jgi:hypothetical protein